MAAEPARKGKTGPHRTNGKAKSTKHQPTAMPGAARFNARPNAKQQPLLLNLADIIIGTRHRKDAGDIEELATNIKEVGLLQPICVTPAKELVDGWRRLLAAQLLGCEKIACHVHDIDQIVAGEFSTTIHRKNYSISTRKEQPQEHPAGEPPILPFAESTGLMSLDDEQPVLECAAIGPME